MKKLLILATCILMLALTACGGQNTVTYKPEKPYWLSSNDYSTVPPSFKEVCTYTLSHDASSTPNENVTAEYTSGSLITELTASKYPEDAEEACFLFTSTYTVSGTFTIGEDITRDFIDVTENKTYFSWKGGFNALYSEQNVQSTLPVNQAGSEDEHGNRFIQIKYTTAITYGDRDATATFKINAEGEEKALLEDYFALKDGQEQTFKKYRSKSNYIDSNLLFLAPRAFNYSDALTYSFKSIDVLSGTSHSMSLSAGAKATDLKNLTLNSVGQGDTVIEEGETYYSLKVQAYDINIAINETYKGSPMTARYISENENKYRHFMSNLTTVLPYKLGTLHYTLTSVVNA